MTPGPHFWERKSLAEMDHEEWEALCDGCGRCCLIKLEDEMTGVVDYTRVVCHLFDERSCRCTRYAERTRLVPDCVRIQPDSLAQLHYLPYTCAYRTLHEGRPLPDWHPLVSGRRDSVFEAGIAVRGRVISETFVHPEGLDEHRIDWVAQGPADE